MIDAATAGKNPLTLWTSVRDPATEAAGASMRGGRRITDVATTPVLGAREARGRGLGFMIALAACGGSDRAAPDASVPPADAMHIACPSSGPVSFKTDVVPLIGHCSTGDGCHGVGRLLTWPYQALVNVVAADCSDQRVFVKPGNLSPALQAELDNLQAHRNELATRRQAASDPRHADALQELVREVQRLETELSRKSATFRTHAAPLTIESVQAALPINTTLVEFVRYRRFDPDNRGQQWREARYIAYILQREGPPQWEVLGDAEPIEAAVTAALSALTKPGRDARDLLRTLNELVFAPIRRRLGPMHHYLLSPDATLHLVPFAALVDEDGYYLIERMLISYVTSGRDLIRSGAEDVARSKPLVVAAPAYEGRCAPLPGAEAEAEAIRKHFADVDLYLGSLATKDKLTAAQGPLFVHVATHGFFRASHASASSLGARSWRDERDITEVLNVMSIQDNRPDIELALDDAGLIFAGDSDTETTLTAREIASVDLRGTQLIVLSACDSGIGEVDRNEGIYGLRRALAIAGAQTQVVSLWKIDDIATSQLMDRYYGELRRGVGRSEALRQAQLDLLRDGRHTHPFYWAAFFSIGDEKRLQLQAASSSP